MLIVLGSGLGWEADAASARRPGDSWRSGADRDGERMACACVCACACDTVDYISIITNEGRTIGLRLCGARYVHAQGMLN
jgi:hypothetical protein